MAKLKKNIFGKIILVFLLFSLPFLAEAQKPSRKASNSKKKNEKVQEKQKKAYQKARKIEVKRRFNMQTPKTQDRMKQNRKEAKRFNKVKKEPFLKRLFHKKRHPKTKKKRR